MDRHGEPVDFDRTSAAARESVRERDRGHQIAGRNAEPDERSLRRGSGPLARVSRRRPRRRGWAAARVDAQENGGGDGEDANVSHSYVNERGSQIEQTATRIDYPL